jgi:hypothetical protein
MMQHDHNRCLTCRRLDAERRAADRADALNLLAVVLGVVVVCLLCLAIAG